MKAPIFILSMAISASLIFAQTKDAFDQSTSSTGKSLIDPSRLSVAHSMSFGMASMSGSSSLQSQSFYSTMMQYKFVAPVTLNLNFSMPIHSTFSRYQNMTSSNMQSLEYFKNMPFDVSLTWKPTDNFLMSFQVMNFPAYGTYNDYDFSPYRGTFFRP